MFTATDCSSVLRYIFFSTKTYEGSCGESVQLTNILIIELSHSVQHNNSTEVSFVNYKMYEVT
jgi:hypothetical protein